MASWNGFHAFADFEHYVPSGGEPAAFFAAPIFDGDKRIGVAIDSDSDRSNLDAIMAQYAGLGETGDTNLVGPDKLFRTNSRFVNSNEARPSSNPKPSKVDTEAETIGTEGHHRHAASSRTTAAMDVLTSFAGDGLQADQAGTRRSSGR